MAMHEGMHPIELALRAGALQPKIGEQVRPHPASDEVQRVVTRDHTQQRDDQSDRIARDALVRQETAHEQRDILGHRQAPPAQHQDHEQSQVGEVFDVRGNETEQQSLSVGKPVQQYLANFVTRSIRRISWAHRWAGRSGNLSPRTIRGKRYR